MSASRKFSGSRTQQDPTWRGLTSAAQQYNLLQATVDRAYQYQQLSSQQVAALMLDPSISSDNRRGAIKQIQEELERQLTGLIGTDAYSQFRKTLRSFFTPMAARGSSLSGPPADGPMLDSVAQRVISVVGDGARTPITVTPR